MKPNPLAYVTVSEILGLLSVHSQFRHTLFIMLSHIVYVRKIVQGSGHSSPLDDGEWFTYSINFHKWTTYLLSVNRFNSSKGLQIPDTLPSFRSWTTLSLPVMNFMTLCWSIFHRTETVKAFWVKVVTVTWLSKNITIIRIIIVRFFHRGEVSIMGPAAKKGPANI